MVDYRRKGAFEVRLAAAEMAKNRIYPQHRSNGDEHRYANAQYAMSFTKGLDHNYDTGLINDKEDFLGFRRAIDEGFINPFTTLVKSSDKKVRPWEAPTAGIVYELEGPDPQAVTMQPAPALGSDELDYEMAEVYELALLRDKPFTSLTSKAHDGDVAEALKRLNKLEYTKRHFPGRPRTTDKKGEMTAQTVFRGSSPKVDVGPYLSQFMLIGNEQPGHKGIDHGYIQYGALRIDQRVPAAIQKDYLTDWDTWLKAQNGEDFGAVDAFETNPSRRFITDLRDLAIYVRNDALYEAYLNACLILLTMKAPFDPGFENLSGGGTLFSKWQNSIKDNCPRAAGGFALYGGPHILTLVTEVATRALKAVRFQKFNTHIRLRPEALAARIERASAIENKFPHIGTPFSAMAAQIKETIDKVRAKHGTALLPMAFPEGSPMHPSYGAGHATVAGACVTILKAFFDTDAVFVQRQKKGGTSAETTDTFQRYEAGDTTVQYVPNAVGDKLIRQPDCSFLTLEGELNKLAANISIGRNIAGVHYYSDYYDSLRMGEEIAIGILQEQALCYPTDPFVLTVPTFDGDVVRIGAR